MADSDGKVRIEIDTNAKEASKALDSASKSFDKTSSSAKNAGSVFSSLQKEVSQNTDKLRELALSGGQNTAEFKRIAASVRETQRAINEANKTVEQATGGLANQQSGMNNLISTGKKLLAGYIGIQAAIKSVHYLLDSTQAFRTQERAIISLNTALENAGVYSDEYSKHLQDLAASIQKYSNYGDEAILKAQSVAQAFIGSIPITDDLTRAVVDFAAAMDMDLEQAFTLVGKSIGSSTNALSRYGVELKKGMTDSQKMEAITQQLGERYAGQAENMANATEQLKNAAGDLSEAIGGLVNPVIEDMEKKLIKLTEATTKQVNALNVWLSSEKGLLDNLSDAWGKYWASRTKTKAGAMNFTVNDDWLQKQRQSGIFAQTPAAAPTKARNIKPFKVRDDFGSSTSSKAVVKAKDDYEKLQAAVAKAKREIELLAIAHGTDSQQVQNAFINYRELNTQLANIDALFTTEKAKITENVGAYQQLNDQINKLKTELLDLATQGDTSSDYFNNLKAQYIAAVEQMENINKTFTQSFKNDFQNIGSTISSSLSNAILTPLSEGENYLQRFGNLGLSIINQLASKSLQSLFEQITLEKTILAIKTAQKAVSSFFGFSDGGVFENGNVVAFARGGVVNKPTFFPMANGGTGLMGEAGAEAVMPLRRMSNGRLGVEAQSEGAPVVVNIFNQSDAQVQTRQRDNGSMDIIISKVNEALKSERTSSGFRAAYQREDRKGLQAV